MCQGIKQMRYSDSVNTCDVEVFVLRGWKIRSSELKRNISTGSSAKLIKR